MDKILKLDRIKDDLIEILNKYHSIMDADNQIVLDGLIQVYESLDTEHETFEYDVKYYLNLAIILCTGFEDNMEQEDQAEIAFCMEMISQIDAMDNLTVGKLVIYEDMPYQIYEIDYEDCTVQIGYKEDENCVWVNPLDIKFAY